MFRLVLTEGKDVTTMTFCDLHGLDMYLEINDLPAMCPASMKELVEKRTLPPVTVDGKTITISKG